MTRHITIESRNLALRVRPDTGAFSVTHKPTGTEWGEDPWWGEVGEVCQGEHGPVWSFARAAEIDVAPGEDGFAATYRGLRRSDTGACVEGSIARVRVTLDGDDDLVAVLEDLSLPEGEWFSHVVFPARFGSLRTDVDTGYLVDPAGFGAVLPSHEHACKAPEIWRREDARAVFTRPLHGGAMSFGGMVRDRGAMLFTAEPGNWFDLGLQVIPNYHEFLRLFHEHKHVTEPRIAAVCPIHYPVLGAFRHARPVRYRFVAGSYSEVARAYRRRFEEVRGTLPTLRERADEDERIDRFVGAPMISVYGGYPHYVWRKGHEFTYKGVTDIARDLKDGLGMERAIVHLWGMYEYTAADPFPWSERPGPLEDLRNLVKTTRDLGYLFMPYTYYSSYQPECGRFDWSQAVEYDRPMVPASDVWKWNQISSRHYADIGRRMFAKFKEMGMDAIQMDIVTAGGFREESCADPPRTRADDHEECRALYEVVREENLLAATEAFKDWALGYAQLFMGPENSRGTFRDGFPAPLTSLAFHDVAHQCRFQGDPYNSCWDINCEYVKKSLQDLCWGCPPIFVFNEREYEGWKPWIADADAVVARAVRRVGYARMVEHAFISEDFQAEQSVWDNGVEMLVNHGVVDVETDTEPLPGRSFRVIDEGRVVQEGCYETRARV